MIIQKGFLLFKFQGRSPMLCPLLVRVFSIYNNVWLI